MDAVPITAAPLDIIAALTENASRQVTKGHQLLLQQPLGHPTASCSLEKAVEPWAPVVQAIPPSVQQHRTVSAETRVGKVGSLTGEVASLALIEEVSREAAMSRQTYSPPADVQAANLTSLQMKGPAFLFPTLYPNNTQTSHPKQDIIDVSVGNFSQDGNVEPQTYVKAKRTSEQRGSGEAADVQPTDRALPVKPTISESCDPKATHQGHVGLSAAETTLALTWAAKQIVPQSTFSLPISTAITHAYSNPRDGMLSSASKEVIVSDPFNTQLSNLNRLTQLAASFCAQHSENPRSFGEEYQQIYQRNSRDQQYSGHPSDVISQHAALSQQAAFSGLHSTIGMFQPSLSTSLSLAPGTSLGAPIPTWKIGDDSYHPQLSAAHFASGTSNDEVHHPSPPNLSLSRPPSSFPGSDITSTSYGIPDLLSNASDASSTSDIASQFEERSLIRKVSTRGNGAKSRARGGAGGSSTTSNCFCPECRFIERLGGPNQALLQGIKPDKHSCPIPGCGKVYKKSSHLKAHSKWHAADKPFVCNSLYCGKRFTHNHELELHRESHKPEPGNMIGYRALPVNFGDTGEAPLQHSN